MPRPATKPPATDGAAQNPFARIAGTHATAAEVVAQAAELLGTRGVVVISAAGDVSVGADDYVQIDPTLAREDAPEDDLPLPGVGYAGLSLAQRTHFLTWLDAPQHPAPLAFQQLYLAHLETCWLEALVRNDPESYLRTLNELRRLSRWPHWAANEQHGRTLLFALRVANAPEIVAEWIATDIPRPLIGMALGVLAARGAALTAPILVNVSARLGSTPMSEAIAALRLDSLTVALGAEPLAWALDKAGDAPVRPWRCAHRDLRLAWAQYDLMPLLEPVLVEMMAGDPAGGLEIADAAVDTVAEGVGKAESKAPSPDRQHWHLILEFGHSRSEYFEFALSRAQKMPGFTALLDENRAIIYRVPFRRSDLRRFWPLWEYVKNWGDSRVFVEGEELEPWKIWPYSQYL